MKTKNVKTDISSNSNLFNLFQEFSRLKHLYRQGWLQNGIKENICESVAEHSFSTALTAWVLAVENFPDLNSDRVLQLALVHDLGEIHTGDITPADNVLSENKYQREIDSVKKTFSTLKSGDIFSALWQEYEQESSPEAAFVKQIDKIEMILQAIVYEHSTGIDLSSFKESVLYIKNAELQEMMFEILNKL